MITSVLITLCNSDGFAVDLDMPAQEKWGVLQPKLIEILCLLDNTNFHPGQKYLFSCNNQLLDNGQSLIQAGVLDGSYIYVYPA